VAAADVQVTGDAGVGPMQLRPTHTRCLPACHVLSWMQLMVLQRAYLTLVHRGFGDWLRDAAPLRRHDR
jgi:hypothetical protein